MEVLVNGRRREVAGPVTVAALLERLELNPDVVHVQVNGRVVDRDAYDRRELTEGDEVEVLMFMGGGRPR